MEDAFNPFIKYGVPNYLATYLIGENAKIVEFRTLSESTLVNRYSLSKEEVAFIKNCTKRKPIEDDIIFRLLQNSNFTCCICKGLKSDAYIIHHIVEYSKTQNNSYENLAVLCPNDHDLAHREGIALTRRLTAKEIKQAKKEWELLVSRYNRNVARIKKSKGQWDSVANKIANYTKDLLFSVHRGAILFDVNTTAVFGNNGYIVDNDEHGSSKEEVRIFREIMEDIGVEELGFGLSDDGYSWCMIMETNKVNLLNECLWKYSPMKGSTNKVQKDIAFFALQEYQEKLLKEIIYKAK